MKAAGSNGEKGSLVGWREWANRGLPFGHRSQREMSGTGLRAVTTYPTVSRQDEVGDFFFNCLCGIYGEMGETPSRSGGRGIVFVPIGGTGIEERVCSVYLD